MSKDGVSEKVAALQERRLVMFTEKELRLVAQCVEHVAGGVDNLELNDLLARLETAIEEGKTI